MPLSSATMMATAPPTSASLSSSATTQAFCLRWNNFQSNLLDVFERLFLDERFVDVTLACEGQLIKAHKMVLSASSSYFQEIFTATPCTHPVVIMKDVPLKDLRKILEFMYKGEINVNKQEIASLLLVAEALHVRGLAQIESQNDDNEPPQPSTSCSANASNDFRKTIKLNRLLKRPSARASSTESLILIDDESVTMQPTKQCRSMNDRENDAGAAAAAADDSNADENNTNMTSPENAIQAIQLVNDTDYDCALHETDDDFMEPQTEYDVHEDFETITIDAEAHVKQEHDDDIIRGFSNDNGVGFKHTYHL